MLRSSSGSSSSSASGAISCAASSRASASASASSSSKVSTASATSAGVSTPCSSRRWMSVSSASATAAVMLISVNELLRLFFAGDGRAVSARLPSSLQTVGTGVPFPSSRWAHQNLVTVCYKTVRTAEKTRLRRDPVVCHERGVGDRHLLGEERLHRLGVPADLELGELGVP